MNPADERRLQLLRWMREKWDRNTPLTAREIVEHSNVYDSDDWYRYDRCFDDLLVLEQVTEIREATGYRVEESGGLSLADHVADVVDALAGKDEAIALAKEARDDYHTALVRERDKQERAEVEEPGLWTYDEFMKCPDLARRLHRRILDLRDEVDEVCDERDSLLSLVQRLLERLPAPRLASEVELEEEARAMVAELGGGEDMAIDHWKSWRDGWLPRKYATREDAEETARLAGGIDPVVGAFNGSGKLVEDVPLIRREE